ncbi:beta-galactosidase [Nonomuraea rhizosphaerae]|uniref:beta-galactosidase n=1 Tax=Nonomuraea rhizosphaerae TaxID=2665663 RepID=UPI001C5D3893|nr:beta-galactosidase [Nonomuraea rhizosphaerae]
MTLEFRDGVAVVDGEPRVLVTADYPYYRDDPAVWADRLRAVRDELGIEVITCYLPWRHHQPSPGTPPDFTGATHPSRDVIGFLELCRDLGLKVIGKPGPFIHAEVTYGGLPDWVCPDHDPAIEALVGASGEPLRWADSPDRAPGRTLPAPLGAVFSAMAAEWLSAAGKVLSGAPVAALQIANEGIYTNGALPLTAYDHSPSGLAFHRGRPAGADRGRGHAEYLAEVYRVWTQATGTDLPVVVNLNPPTVEELDDWLARVRPELWDGITYGFTNWMGVVSSDPDAHARYVIAAKRAPGPNLEENWGFSELYDPAYADAATSFHQSLLALAAGATGVNVYTGVSTSGWLPDLDSAHGGVYPDCAPIRADGTASEKAPVVRALAGFFARHGAEFLECEPVRSQAFGLYLPYAGIAALDKREGQGGPGCGRALRAFHDRMRAQGCDYDLFDLETVTAERLARCAAVTVPGGPFMHRHVQELLAAYEGRVVVDGPVPALDEDMRPCSLLTPSEPVAQENPVLYGRADAYLRSHPGRDVHYLTVLVQDDGDGPVGVRTPLGDVEVLAARGGAAVLRLTGDGLDDLLVKGVNGWLDSAVAARVTFAGETVAAPAPGDLVRIGR